MVRPSDWYLVDLLEDPTPGDAFGVRQVAQKYSDIAYVAANAASVVRGMRGSHSSVAWVGEAGDVFRSETDRMPGELQKADDSYSVVADALSVWASALEDAQAQADRGLALARDAHADLVSAQSALGEAQRSWSTAHAQQLAQQKLQKKYQDVPPPPDVTLPTDAQLRSTSRSVDQSRSSMDAASTSIASANARLDAAKRLVLEANASRDEAERAAVKAIGEAKGKAVKPSSVWEAIQDSAAWQAIVVIATVVLTIVSIVAIFVGGPLVWAIIAAATALLMLNALLSIAQGKNAWLELGLLAIGLIPGGRLIGLAVKGVDALARVGAVGARMAGAIRGATSAVLRGGALIGDRALTVVRGLQRTAQATMPRITSVVASAARGAETARSAVDSFLNPGWLSKLHLGGANLATAGGHTIDAGEHLAGSGEHVGAATGGLHTVDPPGSGQGSELPTGGHVPAGRDASIGGDPRPGTDIEVHSVVAAAQHNQIGTEYRADVYTVVHFNPGDRMEVGLSAKPYEPTTGAPSAATYTGFGAPEGTSASVGFDKTTYWERLQVKENPVHGYREYNVLFQANDHVDLASGFANANHDLVGKPIDLGDGLPQLFQPDFMTAAARDRMFPVDLQGNRIPHVVGMNDDGEMVMKIFARADQLLHLH